MSRPLPIAAVQAAPRLIGEPFDGFAAEVAQLTRSRPETEMVIYPELHLFGDREPEGEGSSGPLAPVPLVPAPVAPVPGRDSGGRTPPDALNPRSPLPEPEPLNTHMLQDAAQLLDGPLVSELRQLAGDLKIWLVPGSICERGPAGELFNTALVLSPEGTLTAAYRKIFPWRPSEPYDPGDRFVVFPIEGVGRFGLSICYDAWFPEHSRHLAWLGADAILNVVKTTTVDRRQELVLARANAIVNQVFMVSVNCAGPVGQGQSVIVDPEGMVRTEGTGADFTLLTDVLDLGHVDRVRRYGTAGLNRMWSQFRSTDAPLDLPLYQGRLDPATWNPDAGSERL